MGESITLVRCWHVQNTSIGGVILNQDTPGGGDVSVTGGVSALVMQQDATTLLGGAHRWEAAPGTARSPSFDDPPGQRDKLGALVAGGAADTPSSPHIVVIGVVAAVKADAASRSTRVEP